MTYESNVSSHTPSINQYPLLFPFPELVLLAFNPANFCNKKFFSSANCSSTITHRWKKTRISGKGKEGVPCRSLWNFWRKTISLSRFLTRMYSTCSLFRGFATNNYNQYHSLEWRGKRGGGYLENVEGFELDVAGAVAEEVHHQHEIIEWFYPLPHYREIFTCQ